MSSLVPARSGKIGRRLSTRVKAQYRNGAKKGREERYGMKEKRFRCDNRGRVALCTDVPRAGQSAHG